MLKLEFSSREEQPSIMRPRGHSIVVKLLLAFVLLSATAKGASFPSPQWYVDLASKQLLESLERGDTRALETVLQGREEGSLPHRPVEKVLKRILVYEDLGHARLDVLDRRPVSIPDGSIRPSLSLSESSLRKRMERVVFEQSPVDETKTSRIFSSQAREFQFPRDHGKHLRLAEWWYFHGHLYSSDGRPFGYELCFFKVLPCIYFCHFAVSDIDGGTFHYSRMINQPFEVDIDKDELGLRYGECRAEQSSSESISLFGKGEDFSLKLDMLILDEPFPIDGDGVIDMPEGLDSYYYSLPRISHRGELTIRDETFKVHGDSWMDHQWGNFYVYQWKWDWFAFQLDDGSEYVLYWIRRPDDSVWTAACNYRSADGKAHFSESAKMKKLDWWQSPHTGNNYVKSWHIELPTLGKSFTVDACIDDQELYPKSGLDKLPTYWEGRCTVKTEDEGPVGVAYCEQFPYDSLSFELSDR